METRPRVAFLGLGQMGAPMALRLVDAGHPVTVWNRSPEKARPLARAGAGVAPTPADAASRASAVITMLATPEAVVEVVTGPDGVLGAATEGQTLIEMSTIGPEAVRALQARLPAT
ncbi:MAG: NAD(P)-binding domain-containing protein, partial [Actinomycetota bacterium]|nr:NAD(P)-binding domain-containing protein [Actinomycetota bacterium]